MLFFWFAWGFSLLGWEGGIARMGRRYSTRTKKWSMRLLHGTAPPPPKHTIPPAGQVSDRFCGANSSGGLAFFIRFFIRPGGSGVFSPSEGTPCLWVGGWVSTYFFLGPPATPCPPPITYETPGGAPPPLSPQVGQDLLYRLSDMQEEYDHVVWASSGGRGVASVSKPLVLFRRRKYLKIE